MKKVLLTIGCGICVFAGALIIWNVVVPFINSILSMFGNVLSNLF